MDARKKLMVATVVLSDRTPPDITAVIAFLHANFSELLGAVCDEPASRADGSHFLEFNDGHVALSFRADQNAWPELEHICETAWWWPQAEPSLRKGQGRVNLYLFASRLEPLHAASVLTAFAAAIAATTDSIGVWWNQGHVVQPPSAFVNEALQIPHGHIPVDCWVHLAINVHDRTTTVVTTGLADFGHCEIEAVEVPYVPRVVLGRVISLAAYLLQNGAIVKDGHSIGYSDQEKILVRRRPSWFRLNCEAYKLEFKKLLVPV